MAIAGQTGDLAPADKKLYALRDVTATVDNISLIASSIMSKKIAAGADVIVLDVKTGSGAFMKTEEDSFALAEEMVKIGNGVGRETYAVISDMNQPLGNYIGNALEVIEAIETLKGNGPSDLVELCLTLGSLILKGVKKVSTIEEGRALLEEVINNGEAFNKFKQFVKAQGGNINMVEDTTLLPNATYIEEILCPIEGYVSEIVTDEVGIATLILGGGRETKESVIDYAVGFKIRKKIGDYVAKDESIATIYANDKDKLYAAKERFINAYRITCDKTNEVEFIKGIVNK